MVHIFKLLSYIALVRYFFNSNFFFIVKAHKTNLLMSTVFYYLSSSFFPVDFVSTPVRPMLLEQRYLILPQSKPHPVKVVHVAVVQSLRPSWCCPKDVNGIASASSAKTVRKRSTRSMPVTVLIKIFTATHATARNGDLTAMDLLVVRVSCKLMQSGCFDVVFMRLSIVWWITWELFFPI